MGRRKGAPAYPGKSVISSVYLTQETRDSLNAKSDTLNRTDSDIMEHALRKTLPTLNERTKLIGETGTFGAEVQDVEKPTRATTPKSKKSRAA